VKVPNDVVLPQVSVLGSTMAYREAGNPDAPVPKRTWIST
jgi:haloalkane dehalogenase